MNAPTRALFSTCDPSQDVPQDKNTDGPDDLKAQGRVLVHLGEEVGVRALLEQPALAFEFRHHGLVGLVKQAQTVQAHDARHRAGA